MDDIIRVKNFSSLSLHDGLRLGKPAPWLRLDRDHAIQSHRFTLGMEASVQTSILAKNHIDLINRMREFARPPFENTFLEFMMRETDDGEFYQQMGLMVVGPVARMYRWKWEDATHSVRQLDYCPVLYRSDLDNIGYSYDNPHIERNPTVDLASDWLDEWRDMFRVFQVFCLLLHQPRMVQIVQHPHRVSFSKGRRTVYAAHTEVVINLDELPKFQRNVRTGARGSPRAHEVRGYFMHRRLRTGCMHDWLSEPVARDRPPRWRCQGCKGLRVWVAEQECRGDASKGWVTKTYRVIRDPLVSVVVSGSGDSETPDSLGE